MTKPQGHRTKIFRATKASSISSFPQIISGIHPTFNEVLAMNENIFSNMYPNYIFTLFNIPHIICQTQAIML